MENQTDSQTLEQIEARFQALGIKKVTLAKRLKVSDVAVYHVFAGRTVLSDKFEKAALNLIEEVLHEKRDHIKRRNALLNPDSVEHIAA